MSVEVKSVGFDGASRCGKGTQIELLAKRLELHKIPYMVVRGDGSKQQGELDNWWKQMNELLFSTQATNHDWNRAAYRLGQELVHTRDVLLPQLAQEKGASSAVLLVDRTLLSRSMIAREDHPENVFGNLYPDAARDSGPKITPEMVCPDVIFHFSASKEALIARLDKKNPKDYEFRKGMIEKRRDWFEEAIMFFPNFIQERIVKINAEQSPEAISEQVWAELLKRFSTELKHPASPYQAVDEREAQRV